MSFAAFSLSPTPRQVSDKENTPSTSLAHTLRAGPSSTLASSSRGRHPRRAVLGGGAQHAAKPYARGRSPRKAAAPSRSSKSASPRKAGYATLGKSVEADARAPGSRIGEAQQSQASVQARGRTAPSSVVQLANGSAVASPSSTFEVPLKSARIQQGLAHASSLPETSTEEVDLMRLIGNRRLLASTLYEPVPLARSPASAPPPSQPRSKLAYRFRDGVAGSSKLDGMAWWYAPSHVLVVRPSRAGTRMPHVGHGGKQGEVEIGTLMPIHAPVYRAQCSRFSWQAKAISASSALPRPQQLLPGAEETHDLRLVSMALGLGRDGSPSPPAGDRPGSASHSVAAWAATVPLPRTPGRASSSSLSSPAFSSSSSSYHDAQSEVPARPEIVLSHPAFEPKSRKVSGSSRSTQSTKVDTVFSSLNINPSTQASSVGSTASRAKGKKQLQTTSAAKDIPEGYNAELDTWDLQSEYDSNGEPCDEDEAAGDASGSSWETVSAADPSDPEHAPLSPELTLKILHVDVPYPSLLHVVNGWLYTGNARLFMHALVAANQLPLLGPGESADIAERLEALARPEVLLRLARLDAIAADAQTLGVADVEMWKLMDRAWSILVALLGSRRVQ